MPFRTAPLLALCVAVCAGGCDSAPPAAADDRDGPTVVAPEQRSGPGSSLGPNAGAGAQQPPITGREPNGPSTNTAGTATAPLVCPSCQMNPGGQTGDFGNGQIEEPCPMPNRPLDAALEQRFRIDEVRAATVRTFSQRLTWGAISDELGLGEVWGETIIDGEITDVGSFEYLPCKDSVIGAATVHFATRDGRLEDTVRGNFTLYGDELGWPAAATPFQVGATSDLSKARGTLDLGIDPTKAYKGELFFGVAGTGDDVDGTLRVRLLEYPDEAARDAAQIPSDTFGAVTIHERAMAFFPYTRCSAGALGRPILSGTALPELGGESAQTLLAQAKARIGAEQPFDGTWLDGSAGRAIIELGELPEEACFGASGRGERFVHLTTTTGARSEDGRLELTMPSVRLVVRPYSGEVERVVSVGPINQPAISVRWQVGVDAPSEGWIEDLEGERVLAWSP